MARTSHPAQETTHVHGVDPERSPGAESGIPGAAVGRIVRRWVMPRSPSPLVAWPIKPQCLAELLEPVGTGLLRTAWATWLKQPSQAPISVIWTPTTKGQVGGGFGEPGVTVWVRPVDRSDHQRVRSAVEAQVIAELVAWIQDAFVAGDAWKLTHHERAWFYLNGSFTAQDRDGFHRAKMEQLELR